MELCEAPRSLRLCVEANYLNAEGTESAKFRRVKYRCMRKSYLYIAILFVLYLVYYHLVWLYFFVFTESENAFHQMAEWLPLAYSVEIYQIAMVNLLLALMAGITFLLYLKRSPYKRKGFLRFLLALDLILILLGIWHVL